MAASDYSYRPGSLGRSTPPDTSMGRPEMRTSLGRKTLAVHKALTQAGVDHAFGGALALAYCAEPRPTTDVDLNVFVPETDIPGLAALLDPLGLNFSARIELAKRDGQCRALWDSTPFDVFFAYDPFHDAMARAARSVPFEGETIRVICAEHLIVCKAVLDQPKHWLDIEQILVSGNDLDVVEMKKWLSWIVGESDYRFVRLITLTVRCLGDAVQ